MGGFGRPETGLNKAIKFDGYDRDNYAYIGIEITNNSAETHDLTFLGMTHRHHSKRGIGIEVRSIVGDTVYDDDLLTLIDFVSKNETQVHSVIFNTSLLYGGLRDKVMCVMSVTGQSTKPIELNDHFKVEQSDRTSIVVPLSFRLGWLSQITQTHIEAGERLAIIFALNRNSDSNIESVLQQANELFNEEKQRKILFLI